jgi:hypothetical protein
MLNRFDSIRRSKTAYNLNLFMGVYGNPTEVGRKRRLNSGQ